MPLPKKEHKEQQGWIHGQYQSRMVGQEPLGIQQVTRGHNIVADGWAGASNPHPHPNPHPTLKHMQKVSKTVIFLLFDSITTDQRTDGWTDGQSLLQGCVSATKNDQNYFSE